MDYFGQVILEILENNQIKSYFANSEIVIFSSISWNFLKEKINLAKSCFKL